MMIKNLLDHLINVILHEKTVAITKLMSSELAYFGELAHRNFWR